MTTEDIDDKIKEVTTTNNSKIVQINNNVYISANKQTDNSFEFSIYKNDELIYRRSLNNYKVLSNEDSVYFNIFRKELIEAIDHNPTIDIKEKLNELISLLSNDSKESNMPIPIEKEQVDIKEINISNQIDVKKFQIWKDIYIGKSIDLGSACMINIYKNDKSIFNTLVRYPKGFLGGESGSYIEFYNEIIKAINGNPEIDVQEKLKESLVILLHDNLNVESNENKTIASTNSEKIENKTLNSYEIKDVENEIQEAINSIQKELDTNDFEFKTKSFKKKKGKKIDKIKSFELNEEQNEINEYYIKNKITIINAPASIGKTTYFNWLSINEFRNGNKVLYMTSTYAELDKYISGLDENFVKVLQDFLMSILYGKKRLQICKIFDPNRKNAKYSCTDCKHRFYETNNRNEKQVEFTNDENAASNIESDKVIKPIEKKKGTPKKKQKQSKEEAGKLIKELLKDERGIIDKDRLIELINKYNLDCCPYRLNLLIIEYCNPNIIACTYDQFLSEYNHRELILKCNILLCDEFDTLPQRMIYYYYLQIPIIRVNTLKNNIIKKLTGCPYSIDNRDKVDCSNCFFNWNEIYNTLSIALEAIINANVIYPTKKFRLECGKHFKLTKEQEEAIRTKIKEHPNDKKIVYKEINQYIRNYALKRCIDNIRTFIKFFDLGQLTLDLNYNNLTSKQKILSLKSELKRIINEILKFNLFQIGSDYTIYYSNKIADFDKIKAINYLKMILDFFNKAKEMGNVRIFDQTNDRTYDGTITRECGIDLATFDIKAEQEALKLIFTKEKVLAMSATIGKYKIFKEKIGLNLFEKNNPNIKIEFASIDKKIPNLRTYLNRSNKSSAYIIQSLNFLENILEINRENPNTNQFIIVPTIDIAKKVRNYVNNIGNLKIMAAIEGDAILNGTPEFYNKNFRGGYINGIEDKQYDGLVSYIRGPLSRGIDLPVFNIGIVYGTGYSNQEYFRYFIEDEDGNIDEKKYNKYIKDETMTSIIQMASRIARDDKKNRVLLIFANMDLRDFPIAFLPTILIRNNEKSREKNREKLFNLLRTDIRGYLNEKIGPEMIETFKQEFLKNCEDEKQKEINNHVWNYVEHNDNFTFENMQQTLQKRKICLENALKELVENGFLRKNDDHYLKNEENWKGII